MRVDDANMDVLFRGFNAAFNKGHEATPSHYKKVAMVVSSVTSENTYGWLGQFPKMREWLGDRILGNLSTHSYSVTNRTFENTIVIRRTDIEDDQYGIYGPMFEEHGRLAGEHPDELMFTLLKNGFTEFCYDGTPFFHNAHPVGDVVVSNIQAGDGPAWFLLDCSRAMKPLLFQERMPYKFERRDNDADYNVFFQDTYIYGVRARVNAGFGLWQLAFASKAPLTAENYEAARKAMTGLMGDAGRPLNVKPDTLLVPTPSWKVMRCVC